MKVLVIDDDVVSRMMLMHLIDNCGTFEIFEAEDGADAWRQLEEGLRPGICFCDLRMPRLSGMELLQRVRATPSLQEIPFVLVSSASDRDTVQQASAAGAAGYIVKPFQAEDVRMHLSGFVDKAPTSYQHVAETPAATLERLGIGAERLLAYLSGFQQQLNTAAIELEVLLAQGGQAEARNRLEKLHAGAATLGLSGAANALRSLLPGQLAADAVLAAVAEAARAVRQQTEIVRESQAGE
ncbi:response regulator [Massilia endophytica]|uniref:response regulator n=1 Tax=Massilia endophytica TaxID=2899220 RepID=UPI001E3DD0A8|nr:response regulator [Massilia endophytica]UGQ47617.1 response regulator [Massilia endophytica]